MLKKKILFLGLLLAGSASGLRAQEINYGDYLDEAPTGLTWDNSSAEKGFHVTSLEALVFYREELIGRHSSGSLTVPQMLGFEKDMADKKYQRWLKENPEPAEEITQEWKSDETSIGMAAVNAYVDIVNGLSEENGTYKFWVEQRKNTECNTLKILAIPEGFTVSETVLKAMTEVTPKTIGTVESALSSSLNSEQGLILTLWTNRYESSENANIGKKLIEVGPFNALTSAEFAEAWVDGAFSFKKLFSYFRNTLQIFSKNLPYGKGQSATMNGEDINAVPTYTIVVENPNYSPSLWIKWSKEKQKQQNLVDQWDSYADEYKTLVKKLYIEDNIDFGKSTFAFTPNDGLEAIYGKGNILTMPANDGAYGCLLGENAETRVYKLGILQGSLRDVWRDGTEQTRTYACFDNPTPYVETATTGYTWRTSDNNGYVKRVKTQYPEPEQGYVVRGAFGMNLSTVDKNGNETREFVRLKGHEKDADLRVFKAAHYCREQSESTSDFDHVFYTNLGGPDDELNAGRPVGNKLGQERVKYNPDKNGFTYIEDAEILDFTTPGKNVVFRGNASDEWVCNYAEFNDADDAEIYVHEDFRAVKLAYLREFPADVNPVVACLPFDLYESDVKTPEIGEDRNEEGGIVKLQTYDGYYQRPNVGSEKYFWFKKVSAVEANKPCVIRFSLSGNKGPAKSLYFGDLTNRVVKKSPLKSVEWNNGGLCVVPEDTGKEGKFYGLYNQQNASTLMTEGNYVYTYAGGKFVQADKTFILYPGRAFVMLSEDLNGIDRPQKIQVRFLDEDGNLEEDSTTGIEYTQNAESEIVGGTRSIEIESNKATDVKVYTVDGKLVKSLRVAAGHTSIPMGAGVYVVNEKKVIVK